MMDKLQCEIDRITYHNEKNGYTVVKVNAKGYENIVAAVGTMPEVHVGGSYILRGDWKIDPKYGMQFMFQEYEEILPTTIDGIKKYLGGKLFKGIGPAYAEKIVNFFGEETLNILDDKPERLAEVPGIGAKRIESVISSWIENRAINRIMLFLQSHDVTISLASKIYKLYGSQSVKIVTENPYRLADEIWGVGFKTADTLAKKLGFGQERFERLQSGILYTLEKLSEVGHCFAYSDELLDAGEELLEVKGELLKPVIKKMIEDNDLVSEPIDEDTAAIYLKRYYYAEVNVARRLKELINNSRGRYIVDIELNAWAVADSKTIRYDDTQLSAIHAALNNKVLVLTGGPGTGKTTTTLGIIRAYREFGAKILLAAPTGRAAKRMSEVTKMEAKTIHRLLETRPSESFKRNEHNPLQGDVLIVDECSMIDILLMNALLKAVPNNMTVILVGDVDQLPSVGAGNVLSDILSSGVVPFVKLNRIFRQAQRSRIITNAHKINRGYMPELKNDSSDFTFIPEEDAEKVAARIVELCTEILPQQYIDKADIQVLTPMRRGVVGTLNLNQKLQEALNPNKTGLKRGAIEYRCGDKVMQIRNNYEKAVFNGDIGFISSMNEEGSVFTVLFEDRSVIYELSEIDELVLAYATTIHKSQGSEFPYVIMPLMKSHYIMLQRNLLYTGVTRAKKGLILIGDRKAVYIAVNNNKIVERNTRLSERLRLGNFAKEYDLEEMHNKFDLLLHMME